MTAIEPMRLMLISSFSPEVIGPTPGGAPVKITSPGTRVMMVEA
ncbi:hypothetical protein PGN05_14890 [Geodermatophilus sp. CPCC 206100]